MPPPTQPKMRTRADLLALQRTMAEAIFRPLDSRWRMQKDGADASDLIKPNDRLSSFERLEIYNRQYWYRLLDCLYDDYPGLQAVMGPRRFLKFATAYLVRHPSDTFALRDLGNRIEEFLLEEPALSAPRTDLAVDMAKFEWAQIVAFDELALPMVTTDDILDTPPAQLTMRLQPYLSLLSLRYELDEYFIALKQQSTDGLRSEASNAKDSAPEARKGKRLAFPKRRPIHLAVHRHDNMIYFKRLDPEAWAILSALRRGATVEAACLEALEATTRFDVDWAAMIKGWFENWSSLGWLCRAK